MRLKSWRFGPSSPTPKNYLSETFQLIELKISSNLPYGVRKVWIDGSLRDFSANLCITYFPISGIYGTILYRVDPFITIDMADDLVREDLLSCYEVLLSGLICADMSKTNN